MPNEEHRESQKRSFQAAAEHRAGNTALALKLFAKAAALEEHALREIPVTKPRTFGILSVSLASLHYKAEQWDESERAAHKALAEPTLLEFARLQLLELLDVVHEDRLLRHAGFGPATTTEVIEVSLRGNQVGVGAAPIGLVLDRISGVHSLLYRITEYLARMQVRSKGGPSQEIQRICQPWVTQPQAGSYRFGIRLLQPLQMELIPRADVSALAISDVFLRLVRSVGAPTGQRVDEDRLENVIKDQGHRGVMLKLIRNIAPDGEHVRSLEFARRRDGSVDRAVLYGSAKILVNQRLKSAQPRQMPGDKEETLSGILRGLHLDQDWIELKLAEGRNQRCEIDHEAYDDVLGPMVDHSVAVLGRWGKDRKFHSLDIELADSSAGTGAHGAES